MADVRIYVIIITSLQKRGLWSEDAEPTKGEIVDQNSTVSAQAESSPLDDIADLLRGVCGPTKALAIAWDLTDLQDSTGVRRVAEEAGMAEVIYAIIWAVTPPKREKLGRNANWCRWVLHTEHGDGCEIIIIERTVKGAPELGSLKMRRRESTDIPELFAVA